MQSGVIDGIKVLEVAPRIAGFLTQRNLFNTNVPHGIKRYTDNADLAKWTDITLYSPVPPIPSDVRHDGQSGRVNVAPAKFVELRLGLPESWDQVTRSAQ